MCYSGALKPSDATSAGTPSLPQLVYSVDEAAAAELASKYDRMLYINLGIFVGIGRMRPHHSFVRL